MKGHVNQSKEIGLYLEKSGKTHRETKQRSQIITIVVQNKGQHRVKAVVLFQVKYNDLNQCCYTGNWREIYVAKSEGFDD